MNIKDPKITALQFNEPKESLEKDQENYRKIPDRNIITIARAANPDIPMIANTIRYKSLTVIFWFYLLNYLILI